MSPPVASADRPPQRIDRAAPFPLEEALVKLRLWDAFGHDSGSTSTSNNNNSSHHHDHHHQVEVGDAWDLGQGLGVVLLAKPSSTHTPARCVCVCTAV